MGPYDYIVDDIKGDYAYLARTDILEEKDPLMIALALLPFGVDIGSNIRFENLEYTIIS
ncbi:MAG: chorismate--pyruvate lyase [Clostridia bacterium]